MVAVRSHLSIVNLTFLHPSWLLMQFMFTVVDERYLYESIRMCHGEKTLIVI